MVGRLILGLIWLTCVQSEILNNMPMDDSSMAVKMPMAMPAVEAPSAAIGGLMPMKAKRYLSHQHSSPCPPFYPHFDMHMPMYAMRPYGPPAYPKNAVPMPIHHDSHQLQYIHQPTYTSYVPKQMVQYVKPQIHAPVYQHPVISPPIHHVQPMIHPVVKQPNYFPHYQHPMPQQKVAYEKPQIFSYAPAYHKPMPMIWPATQIKKIEYPISQPSYNHQPAVIYKPDVPKCAPCPPTHQPQPLHHPPQPSISYVKVAQPTIQQLDHAPSRIYLPAPVHQPIVKPCDK